MYRRPGALVAILVGLLVLPVAGSAFPVSGYTIRLLAGDGQACTATPDVCGGSNGGVATDARITPGAVALAPDGSILVADGQANLLWRVSADGTIRLVAGDGFSCTTVASCGDGGKASNAHVSPQGLTTDGAGTIYIAEGRARTIRRITPDGTISRIAGTGSTCQPPASCGDGGMALAASFNDPVRLALDRLAGILYVADDAAGQVRAIDLTAGTIRLVAGTGTGGPHCVGAGDGTSAIHSTLCAPAGLALDGRGQLYIGDVTDAVVRRVELTTGLIYRYAGTGQACVPNCGVPLGDGGDALGAQLSKPAGLFWDGSGLVIVDLNESLRRVDGAGVIHRIAGAGMCQHPQPPAACGDDGPALAATFFFPLDVSGDGHGGYVVADPGTHQLRHVTLDQPPGITIGLVAYRVTPSAPRHRHALTLGVLLDHAARLTLAVRAGSHVTVVGTSTGRVGTNALKWNGKLGRTFAKAGRYTLVVTATAEGSTTKVNYPVRLR